MIGILNILENLFKVLEKKEENGNTVFTILLADKDHALLKSHFPNNEILAGFLQIDIIASLLNHNIKMIKKAKFISIIYPNETIKYYVSSKDNISYKVIIKNIEDKKISEFSYEI